MGGRLAGKQAFVTAAGQGIGRAIVEAFQFEGAEVVAADLDASKLQGISCRTMAFDLRDRDRVAEALASVEGLDVLVNCVGYVHSGTILETGEEDWDLSFDVNARSMFWTMKAAVGLMRVGGGGAIVNIASVISTVKAAPARFAYSASKGAVIAMTRSVALDFAADGIRANAICPGTVDTPSLRQRVAESPDPGQAWITMVGRQPVGRLGQAVEIAELAVYLASEAGRFATGGVFVVDGGMTL